MITHGHKIFRRSNMMMHKEGYSSKKDLAPPASDKSFAVGVRDLRESVFKKIDIVPINSPIWYHYKGQDQVIKNLGYATGTHDLEKINNLDFSNYYRKI